MKEKIYEIAVFVAPLFAGLITSILIPLLIRRFTIKRLKAKIEEVDGSKTLKNMQKDIAEIKREILQMRGKIK